MGKDCPSREANLARCNCTYEPCSRKGICCECIDPPQTQPANHILTFLPQTCT
jgi:hypothetical protein